MSRVTKYDIEKLAEFENEIFEAEHIEVAPNIYQSREDFEANMEYDLTRDEQITSNNEVY